MERPAGAERVETEEHPGISLDDTGINSMDMNAKALGTSAGAGSCAVVTGWNGRDPMTQYVLQTGIPIHSLLEGRVLNRWTPGRCAEIMRLGYVLELSGMHRGVQMVKIIKV